MLCQRAKPARDIHDASRVGFADERQEGLRNRDQSEKVRVKRLPERLHIHLARLLIYIERDSGVVDENVQLAEFILDKTMRRLVRRLIVYVKTQELNVQAFGLLFRRRFLPALLVPRAE